MNSLDTIQSYIRASDTVSLGDLQLWANKVHSNIHVAIMSEPYLSKVRSGEKYIESRLTKVNIAPFQRAAEGDIILFKRSGGAILAMAPIGRVEFAHLTSPDELASLAKKYASGLGYESGYVDAKQDSKFASLLWLDDVRDLPATLLEKRGRQAWITLRAS